MGNICNPSLQELRQKDLKFEFSLGYITSPSLKKPRAGHITKLEYLPNMCKTPCSTPAPQKRKKE
jgi:hypothetical protein